MEVIYSAFYQVMAQGGSRETFTALGEQFEAGLEPAELSEQAWWELQIRALALGRYDELVATFGEHHPETDSTPYRLDQIDGGRCIEMIDWFSLLATSTVDGFSEWATLAETAEQQPFVETEVVLPVNDVFDERFVEAADEPDVPADLIEGLTDELGDKLTDAVREEAMIGEAADDDQEEAWDELGLFADLIDESSNLDELVDDQSEKAASSMAEEKTPEMDNDSADNTLLNELFDEKADILTSMDYDDETWTEFFESSFTEKQPQEDKPAHVRVLTMPEVPLDQLEETLSWLDDLVTEEAESGDKSLEAMDFDEALAWFGDLEDDEHTPATVFDDDFVSAEMAFESKAAEKYYEPVDDDLLDDMPPDDPDAALDWLRELILDMDAPSGFDGDLDEVTAWFEEHRPE